MGAYVGTPVGTTLADLAGVIRQQHESLMSVQFGNVEPTVKPIGTIWHCTLGSVLTTVGAPPGTTAAMVRWNGTVWVYMFRMDQAVLNANGSVPLAGSFNCGNQRMFNLGAASFADDAVRMDQTVLRSGANAMTGSLNMNGQAIVNLPAPSAPTHPLRLGDVAAFAVTDYRTNRAATNPLVLQDEANQSATFCRIGFVPREVRVRLSGRLWRQSTNAADGSGDIASWEATLHRWDDQTAGGDAGTAVFAAAEIPESVRSGASTSGRVFLLLQWNNAATPADRGFWLRLRRTTPFIPPNSPDSGTWLELRNPADTNEDGVVHAMSRA
jgi:hypothetical protein